MLEMSHLKTRKLSKLWTKSRTIYVSRWGKLEEEMPFIRLVIIVKFKGLNRVLNDYDVVIFKVAVNIYDFVLLQIF